MNDLIGVGFVVALCLIGLGLFAIAAALRDMGWHLRDVLDVALGDKPRPLRLPPDPRPLRERIEHPLKVSTDPPVRPDPLE